MQNYIFLQMLLDLKTILSDIARLDHISFFKEKLTALIKFLVIL